MVPVNNWLEPGVGDGKQQVLFITTAPTPLLHSRVSGHCKEGPVQLNVV